MRRKGFVTAGFALFLPVAITIIAVVVDVGLASLIRMNLQQALDFGSLSAVQELDLDLLAQGTCWLDPSRAEDVALSYAWMNLGSSLTPGCLDGCRVLCTVFNPGNLGFHGPEAVVAYPIVCMSATLTMTSPLTHTSRVISAHADASLVPRH